MYQRHQTARLKHVMCITLLITFFYWLFSADRSSTQVLSLAILTLFTLWSVYFDDLLSGEFAVIFMIVIGLFGALWYYTIQDIDLMLCVLGITFYALFMLSIKEDRFWGQLGLLGILISLAMIQVNWLNQKTLFALQSKPVMVILASYFVMLKLLGPNLKNVRINGIKILAALFANAGFLSFCLWQQPTEFKQSLSLVHMILAAVIFIAGIILFSFKSILGKTLAPASAAVLCLLYFKQYSSFAFESVIAVSAVALFLYYGAEELHEQLAKKEPS